ncbi:sortase [Patescibacteria group bacterium]
MTHYSIKKHKLKSLSSFLIFAGITMLVLTFGPIIKDEIWFFLKELKSQDYRLGGSNSSGAVKDSVFARYLSSRPVIIEPVNKDFSIVIERIGVNAPIVADVSVTDETKYLKALRNGVAHASVSKYPSEKPGNIYMFAHASVDFWKLGKYATVFNLLRKVDIGDRIHIFYKNKTYVYETVNKEVHEGWNTYPITRPVIEPTLTLQTCDPPGTTLNRLVVTANLVDVIE